MRDQFGREIDYLRISLTDRCNLRCVYCMPENGICHIPKTELLTQNEIFKVCKCARDLGISKIKLTGGEPLLRKICVPLLRELKKLPGIEQVTLTTNGMLLEEYLPELMDAGLDGVNISLDTMEEKTFEAITRRNAWKNVWNGIQAAMEYPALKVKINCVPSVQTKEDLQKLAFLAKENPVHVRFIEMMPVGQGKEFAGKEEAWIRSVLEETYGKMIPMNEKLGNGPCRYYTLDGFQGKIGFISALSHKFCGECNRVRLTSTGFLKGCLQYEEGEDLRRLLRNGSSEEVLKNTIQKAIYQKSRGHNFKEKKNGKEESHIMAQIGG